MRQVGVLLAAGKSERFLYKNTLKQFIEVYQDIQLYEFALNTMLDSKQFNRIYLVVPQEYLETLKEYWVDNAYVRVIAGGETRYESCKNAIKYAYNEFKDYPGVFVTFVDASSPLVSRKTILSIIEKAMYYGGATAVTPARWITGIIDPNTFVLNQTLAQKVCCEISTPQTFGLSILISLFNKFYHAAFEDLVSGIIKLDKIKIATIPTTESGFRIINSYDYIRFIDELKRSK